MNRCAECHVEAEALRDAPHFRTLAPADAPRIRERFAGREIRLGERGFHYRFVNRDGTLWFESDTYPEPLRVDWVFGSGEHAQTPVAVWRNPQGRDELLQLRVSWYPNGSLGETLGLDDAPPLGRGVASLGVPLNHAETRHCFGCHTTWLPTSGGRIDFDRMVPGVRCERCHPGSRRHAEAISAGNEAPETMPKWSELKPRESINRCGECHRRADELTPKELTPTNRLLIRFSPVGLSQSACFQQQDSLAGTHRLDCLTCHDPHRSATDDPGHYVRTCLGCHGQHTSQASVCSSQPMDSDCLSCHMPQVEVQENLHFTDHWIRVRRNRRSEFP